MTQRSPKAGDRVVFAVLPEWVDELREETARILRFCHGRTYEVSEIDDNGLLVLDVSPDIDARFGGFMNDIRVEPEYVRLVPSLAERVVFGLVGAVLGALLGLLVAFLRDVDWRLAVFVTAPPAAVAGIRWGDRVLGILKAMFWNVI